MFPRPHLDVHVKILSVRLEDHASRESEVVAGRVVLDYDGSGNLTNVEILPWSLSEFGVGKPIAQRKPMLAIDALPS